jgi:hypothetical protein
LGIQHFMGYGGVSGRPSFPNMDRSVFRAYELCLVPLSFLGGSEPLALALALGAFWMFRRRRIFVAVWLRSLAVTVRPLIIFVLVGIGILICSAVGNLFWRCAADCAPLHITRLWGSQRDWSPWSFIWMALPRYCGGNDDLPRAMD